MSLLHRQIKYGKSSANTRSFKALTGQKPARQHNSMGLPRVLATSAVLSFAAFSCYVTLLYLMPFASPKQFLGITQQNQAAAALDGSSASWLRNKILRPFEIKGTFLGQHQGIRAHYVIPEGTTADIHIDHCMRSIIIEAFQCKVVATSEASINGGVGTRMFKFNKVGFYRFNAQLRYTDTGQLVPMTEQQRYRIIWARD